MLEVATVVGLMALQAPQLSKETVDPTTRLLDLDGLWRFRVGDDPAWASPGYDDSTWKRARTANPPKEMVPGFEGIAWFRTPIVVAPEMAGRVVLWVDVAGTAELFLDGEKIYAAGRIEGGRAVAPEAFVASPVAEPIHVDLRAGRHLLALRYASQLATQNVDNGFLLGVVVRIGEVDSVGVLNRRSRASESIHQFFIGAAFVLGLLHLLIFLFMKRRGENAAFALAVFSVGGIAYFSRVSVLTTDFETARVYLTMFKLSLIGTSVFSVLFYHLAFLDRVPRLFFLLASAGLLLAIAAYWTDVRVVYAFASLSFLEPARVLIGAVLKRQRDAWIILIGGAFSMVAALLQMLPFLFGSTEDPGNVYLYGFLVLLLSMSVYLARRIARTRADLEAQLVQVKTLSERTIAQEKEAQRRQTELEEANKRAALLEELRVAHEDLKRAQSKLVQSEKMAALGQLVAGVAHEINTPIGAVYSMRDSLARATEKLRAEIPPEVAAEKPVKRAFKVLDQGLRVIETGSGRVAEIVKRLKTFARLDEADVQSVDLHEGIEDTLLLIGHQLKRGVEVDRQFGELPEVRCFPGQLNQVFLNLFVNAVQAMDGQGRLTIATRVDGPMVEVAITDTGVGIPEEHRAKIFDPGFTTKGVGVGTGLGLSICYSIVEQHGGEITVESRRGEGTTFRVRIPVQGPEAE